MLDELKVLIETVADIPELAVWVAFGFLFYKVFIWGSVVAAGLKAWSWAVDAIKHSQEQAVIISEAELEREKTLNKKEYVIDDITITGCEQQLRNQIVRLAGKGTGVDSNYIHECSVRWLREAIDEKEKIDAEKGLD